MSSGHGDDKAGPWIVAGAVVALAYLLAIVGITQSYLHQTGYQAEKASRANAEIDSIPHDECAKIVASEERNRCLYQQKIAAEKREREGEDLYAQQRMADWAFWMIMVTWLIGLVGNGVTIVGVLFVIKTFNEQRRATDLASDTARRQLRAYLIPVTAKITMEDDGRYTVTADAENGGQTPANNVEMRVNGSIMTYPNPGVVVVLKTPFGSRAPVRKGGRTTVTSHPRIATLEDRTAIAQGTKAVYACGGLSYADIFDAKWERDFRFTYCGPWGGTHIMYVAAEGNDPERKINEEPPDSA